MVRVRPLFEQADLGAQSADLGAQLINSVGLAIRRPHQPFRRTAIFSCAAQNASRTVPGIARALEARTNLVSRLVRDGPRDDLPLAVRVSEQVADVQLGGEH